MPRPSFNTASDTSILNFETSMIKNLLFVYKLNFSKILINIQVVYSSNFYHCDPKRISNRKFPLLDICRS